MREGMECPISWMSFVDAEQVQQSRDMRPPGQTAALQNEVATWTLG